MFVNLCVFASAWLPMLLIAILNGVIREYTYGKILATSLAHQISSFLLIAILGLYTYVFSLVFNFDETAALCGGCVWGFLTLLFEFVFGFYVIRKSWRELCADYDITQGKLWLIVVVSIFAFPSAVVLLQKWF